MNAPDLGIAKQYPNQARTTPVLPPPAAPAPTVVDPPAATAAILAENDASGTSLPR